MKIYLMYGIWKMVKFGDLTSIANIKFLSGFGRRYTVFREWIWQKKHKVGHVNTQNYETK